MTPAQLSGVWQRTSIAINGGEPSESATVLWFQLGDDFIDARFPREPKPMSGPLAFAGRTIWQEPMLTWEHSLDSSEPTSPGLAAAGSTSARDEGRLSWDGGRLIETGSLLHEGCPLQYVEVWERVEEAAGTPCFRSSFAAGFGCVMQIGSRRLAMLVDPASRRWAAVHQIVEASVWRSANEFGDQHLRNALVRFVELDSGNRLQSTKPTAPTRNNENPMKGHL